MFNVVTVRLRTRVPDDVRERRYLSNSSCGICGKAALEEIEVRCAPVGAGPTVAASVLGALPDAARARTSASSTRPAGCTPRPGSRPTARCATRARTSAGTTRSTSSSATRCSNGELPLADDVLLVSGRLSFELVQKAAVAGIPVLCAVSAPSSLAVAAADQLGQTVVGFLRDGRFNVYTHPERIDVNA